MTKLKRHRSSQVLVTIFKYLLEICTYRQCRLVQLWCISFPIMYCKKRGRIVNDNITHYLIDYLVYWRRWNDINIWITVRI